MARTTAQTVVNKLAKRLVTAKGNSEDDSGMVFCGGSDKMVPTANWNGTKALAMIGNKYICRPFNNGVECACGCILLHVNKLSSGVVDEVSEELNNGQTPTRQAI